MNITVQYHAMLREQKGRAEEVVQTTAHDLTALHAQLNLSLDPAHLKVAINDEMAEWDTKLNDGDTVMFIPPVAGG